jgi:phosphoribosyl-AMP cyclohydrolase
MQPSVAAYGWVLVHSPLTGPDTWELVAGVLRKRGCRVVVPDLRDDGRTPCSPQHAASVAAAAANLDGPVVLAGHSGAGPLLPQLAAALTPPPVVALFADAGLPVDGANRLDLIGMEHPASVAPLAADLAAGRAFPSWSSDDLSALVPDVAVRERLVAGLRPRGLDYFTEAMTIPAAWSSVRCGYLRFSDVYDVPARIAEARGWPVVRLDANHFHPLVDPAAVADALLALASDVVPAAPGADPSDGTVALPARDGAVALRFDERGLMPAVVQQHDTGEVLMVAWMTRDSLDETLATGQTVFWSRSRGERWHKGATSGNTQRVVQVIADCDADVLLIKVEQGGGGVACHTGARSCFLQPLTG